MEKKKFSYELEVIHYLRNYEEKFKDKGLELDKRYIDYYGDTCPYCGEKMKVYRNEIKNVGSLSAFVILEQNKGVVYCLCKKCSKQLTKDFGRKYDNKKVETKILEKIPDLKRDDSQTTRKKVMNELDILTLQ